MRRLTEFLLPRDAREHVLGDLEEIGFTWRNLASVLPRVWISHVRRAWNAPAQDWKGASEADFYQGVLRLKRGKSVFGFMSHLWPLWYLQSLEQMIGAPRGLFQLLFAVIAAMLYWSRASRRAAPPSFRLNPNEPETWRAEYCLKIQFRRLGLVLHPFTAPAGVFLFVSWLLRWWRPAARISPLLEVWGTVVLTGIPFLVALVYSIHEYRRVNQELKTLDSLRKSGL